MSVGRITIQRTRVGLRDNVITDAGYSTATVLDVGNSNKLL